ncbi:MAG TPA: NAD(P)-binding domain-containing protein [Sinomonas sp.]|jgi:2-hydroxy-3-oxopropionate reductase|nr:NAD(P)-binding domain-containing protein [Sinomonas sp.]
MANVAVVLAMLPDCPDMEEVVLGTGGALEFARPDTLLIDASTIRPEVRAANQADRPSGSPSTSPGL